MMPEFCLIRSLLFHAYYVAFHVKFDEVACCAVEIGLALVFFFVVFLCAWVVDYVTNPVVFYCERIGEAGTAADVHVALEAFFAE